jgi:hypothetical protein
MGTEKLAALFVGALIAAAGILAAIYAGEQPDWGPIGELLTELASGAGAGAAAFVVVERIKTWWPQWSGERLFWTHLGLAVVLGPLAYGGLVWLNLTEVTSRGAMLVAGAAFTTGKIVYQKYKNSPKEQARQLVKAVETVKTAQAEGQIDAPVTAGTPTVITQPTTTTTMTTTVSTPEPESGGGTP